MSQLQRQTHSTICYRNFCLSSLLISTCIQIFLCLVSLLRKPFEWIYLEHQRSAYWNPVGSFDLFTDFNNEETDLQFQFIQSFVNSNRIQKKVSMATTESRLCLCCNSDDTQLKPIISVSFVTCSLFMDDIELAQFTRKQRAAWMHSEAWCL